MKKIIILSMFLMIALCSFAQSSAYYRYQTICLNNGYSIGLEQQARVMQGNTAYCYVTFHPGTTYKVVAMSDDPNVKDVDIYVYHADETLIAKDADTSNLAVVDLTCNGIEETAKIVIKNYRSLNPYHASMLRFFIAYY